MVRGYWNRPEDTAPSFTRGWLHTGDVARIDEEGFVHIVDRAKDMIIRGGENVYCVEVEAALFEHPAVADCAVIGVPHPVLGEEVGAVVVLRPGARGRRPTSWPASSASGWPPSTCPPGSGSGPNRSPATRPARSSSASCGPSCSGTSARPDERPPGARSGYRSAASLVRVTSTSRPIWSMRASTLSKATSSRRRDDEGDPGLLAVEVAGEVEQVGLHQQVAVGPVEGRAAAHRDGRLPARTRPAARTSRRRCPAPGRQMPAGTATLAVGNPSSVPPRWSPWTTAPRTWWGRPSSAAASSTRPAATRLRIRVDEMGSAGLAGPVPVGLQGHARPPRTRPALPSPAAGPRSPCGRGRSGSPRPPPPAGRRGPRPGSRRRIPRPSRWPAPRRRAPPPSGPRPAASSSSSFWSRSQRRHGADSGRTTVAGWRSKVTTTVVRPSARGPGRELAEEGPMARGGRRRRRRWSPPIPRPEGRQVDGSVTMSITGEGYCRGRGRRRGRRRPTAGRRRRSSGRLEHHGRADPVGLGGLVHGQQPVALVDQAPGAVAGDAQRHPVEGQAPGHQLLRRRRPPPPGRGPAGPGPG